MDKSPQNQNTFVFYTQGDEAGHFSCLGDKLFCPVLEQYYKKWKVLFPFVLKVLCSDNSQQKDTYAGIFQWVKTTVSRDY